MVSLWMPPAPPVLPKAASIRIHCLALAHFTSIAWHKLFLAEKGSGSKQPDYNVPVWALHPIKDLPPR